MDTTKPDGALGTIAKVPIVSQYEHCENSFNLLLEIINDQAIAERVLNEFGRFRVWAENSGVNRTGRVSLDHRLREASHLQEELTKLLGELNRDLEDGVFFLSRYFCYLLKAHLNLHNTEFQAFKLIEVGESNSSSHSLIDLGEEFMKEHGFLDDEEPELTKLEPLVLDIVHIITCLYKFSIAIQYPAPKERLGKIELIDVSNFEELDIKYIDRMFGRVDSQNNLGEARYLIERLGRANTRRRKLFKYYEAHNQEVSGYIDARERSELVDASKPVTSAPASEMTPAYTTLKSETTLPTVKVEHQLVQLKRDEDQLSITSYSTSTNYSHIPPPPNKNVALKGERFQCPYCWKKITIRDQPDWKYVSNYAYQLYSMLTFIESMYLKISSPISAHSVTAPRQKNYTAAKMSGLIMRYSCTGESGTVLSAQSLSPKRHDFKSI